MCLPVEVWRAILDEPFATGLMRRKGPPAAGQKASISEERANPRCERGLSLKGRLVSNCGNTNKCLVPLLMAIAQSARHPVSKHAPVSILGRRMSATPRRFSTFVFHKARRRKDRAAHVFSQRQPLHVRNLAIDEQAHAHCAASQPSTGSPDNMAHVLISVPKQPFCVGHLSEEMNFKSIDTVLRHSGFMSARACDVDRIRLRKPEQPGKADHTQDNPRTQSPNSLLAQYNETLSCEPETIAEHTHDSKDPCTSLQASGHRF